MPARKLQTHRVEKPWGRHHLFPGFDDPAPDGEPVGEVWFQEPGDTAPDLLIKYLFTDQKLSVQDHPDDADAQKRGLPRGKDECWTVLSAEPGAVIALGPKEPVAREALRAASLDGSIEDLLDWKPVAAGDFLYCAAGTIHAIGGGLTVIEVQQNSETTYRLYDYGSDRELHLDDGLAVAHLEPYRPVAAPGLIEAGRTILVEGPKFVLERWSRGRDVRLPQEVTGWLVPIAGRGTADDIGFRAGECVALTGAARVDTDGDADLLFAYPGARRITA